MDQHDIDDELASAGDLLQSPSAAYLAYTAADGTPRVSPVGFFWTGEELVVATAATAPKVAALRARPDVAMSINVSDAQTAARQLAVRGRAEITMVDGVVEEYLAASRKGMEPEAAAQFEQACRDLYDRMARIAIRPRWARYYDFGTGRLPRFLQELAEQSAARHA
ncbi:pyridoxamine 5'-phosphate oxidase family protein [Isoptericola sp. 4D.3]|uniref:Pyridoxamine 5'-phosphate oxidase family protein n=1 Tax=Isoptericola peretonis TaxID=2918523 RepID=A0ABT0J8X4_9MICO|nr:pyridoxamine 5'-phosphate oxidase family protein [Isoptericola sp. 4D.3]